MSFRNISPRRLKDWLERDPASVFLLDVRQPNEYSVARIEGASLIPLHTLGQRLDEVPDDVRVVCMCHHGMRSAHACDVLAAHGWTRLYNLEGGIHRWSAEIDPDVPVY